MPHDPLVDTEQCQRDITRMSELGVNGIRVYHVDPSADHKGCMEAFAEAGIYLFVDLDTFETQIEQVRSSNTKPPPGPLTAAQEAPHWNETQFTRFQAVLDEFQAFPNTAGVFVGNEVITTKEGSAAAPYVLAAARDMKVYRDMKGYRNIPVGYSAADIAELRPMLQNYLACGESPSDRLDFFALNAYEWCGESSYMVSGYNKLQENATDYPIPIFFSETGCNAARPRTFEDQAAIFGDEMVDTWSGSIVYEWIQETNDYGLISYGTPTDKTVMTIDFIEDGFTRKGTPTPVMPDFDNLKMQWATLSPTGVRLSEYAMSTTTLSPPQCPEPSLGWSVDAKSPLPTLGQAHGLAGPTVANPVIPTDEIASPTETGLVDLYSGASANPALGGAGSNRTLMAAVLLGCAVGFVAFWL